MMDSDFTKAFLSPLYHIVLFWDQKRQIKELRKFKSEPNKGTFIGSPLWGKHEEKMVWSAKKYQTLKEVFTSVVYPKR